MGEMDASLDDVLYRYNITDNTWDTGFNQVGVPPSEGSALKIIDQNTLILFHGSGLRDYSFYDIARNRWYPNSTTHDQLAPWGIELTQASVIEVGRRNNDYSQTIYYAISCGADSDYDLTWFLPITVGSKDE